MLSTVSCYLFIINKTLKVLLIILRNQVNLNLIQINLSESERFSQTFVKFAKLNTQKYSQRQRLEKLIVAKKIWKS